MEKEEIMDIINENTIQCGCYDKVFDRESFARGFLVALLRTDNIEYKTFNEIWEELENEKI